MRFPGKEEARGKMVEACPERPQDGPYEVIELEASNVYDNMNHSLEWALVIFAAQTTLFLCYLKHVIMSWNPEEPTEPTRWVGWLMTLPLQMVIQGQIGGSFFDDVVSWASLVQAEEVQKAKTDLDREVLGEHLGWVRTPDWQVLLRAFMDFMVNSVYIDTLLLVFPLILMTQAGEEFVFNAFGVAFIGTLDDEQGSGTMKLRRKWRNLKFEESDEEDEDLEEEATSTNARTPLTG